MKGYNTDQSSLQSHWVKEKYEALKLSASQSGAQIEDDVLFLEAVGVVNKEGTVYGLGSESKAYYERPWKWSWLWKT